MSNHLSMYNEHWGSMYPHYLKVYIKSYLYSTSGVEHLHTPSTYLYLYNIYSDVSEQHVVGVLHKETKRKQQRSHWATRPRSTRSCRCLRWPPNWCPAWSTRKRPANGFTIYATITSTNATTAATTTTTTTTITRKITNYKHLLLLLTKQLQTPPATYIATNTSPPSLFRSKRPTRRPPTRDRSGGHQHLQGVEMWVKKGYLKTL